jgi:tRNA pseudouridine(38-40) synthase
MGRGGACSQHVLARRLLVLFLVGTRHTESSLRPAFNPAFIFGFSRHPPAAIARCRFVAGGRCETYRHAFCRRAFKNENRRYAEQFPSQVSYSGWETRIADLFVRLMLDEGKATRSVGRRHTWEVEGGVERILSVFPASTRNSCSNFTSFQGAHLPSSPPSTRNLSSSSTSKKTKKRTFRMVLAYVGSSTCGWQRQPGDVRTSIQERVEDALKEILGHSVDLRAAGRTDAGVHAIRQTTRFRSNATCATALGIQTDLNRNPLMFLNSTESGKPRRMIRCLHVQEVQGAFHPGFGATQRSYLYLQPWNASSKKDVDCLVFGLNRILRPIVGVSLDYYGFSHGKLSKEHYNCTVSFACAFPVPVRTSEMSDPPSFAIGIALTSDRFLRRMVRILVATAFNCSSSAIHNSFIEDPIMDSSLLRLIQARDRRLTSKPAPADGLVFVGAEYG